MKGILDVLPITEATLTIWRKEHGFPIVKVGGTILTTDRLIADWIERQYNAALSTDKSPLNDT